MSRRIHATKKMVWRKFFAAFWRGLSQAVGTRIGSMTKNFACTDVKMPPFAVIAVTASFTGVVDRLR
jgi:hypothetical protein